MSGYSVQIGIDSTNWHGHTFLLITSKGVRDIWFYELSQ